MIKYCIDFGESYKGLGINMHTSKWIISGLLSLSFSYSANAGSLAVESVSLLNEYNLIISGNVTSSSEVDGNALVGGNLSGGLYNIHNTSNAVVPTLTVAGNVEGSVQTNGKGFNAGGDVSGTVIMNGGGEAFIGSVSGTVQNNANGNGSTSVVGDISGSVNTNDGDTTYGGNLTGSATAKGSGTVTTQAVTSPFSPTAVASNAIATLSQFSTSLSGVGSNSCYSITGGKVTFNAIADSSGLAIFTISDAANFFNNAYEFEFNLGTADSILFNVLSSGDTDYTVHANFLAGSAVNLSSMLLWNFIDATSRKYYGSIWW